MARGEEKILNAVNLFRSFSLGDSENRNILQLEVRKKSLLYSTAGQERYWLVAEGPNEQGLDRPPMHWRRLRTSCWEATATS